ncbi:MAG: STAS domain-containing protein [Planctomycetaceae bacterium]|nr:STAS domain-containing protein [Planctomycetaceae bacterium]
MNSSQHFKLSRSGNTVVVQFEPCPSFDPLDHQQEIQQQLSASDYADCPNIVVDCQAIQYANSMFLESLLQISSIAKQREGKFSLSGVGSFLKDLIHITRLDQRWPMFDSVDQAIQSF